MAIKDKKENLTFTDSEAKSNPAILGTLTGPCADIVNPTRNERRYPEKLWEKVFNDEIVKEYFRCGGIFGELGHPADRSETDMEKIAICMPEPPVKGKNGLLMGKWHILNTPNGRILKTLVDYGYKIGISSRGTGDVYTDEQGRETVDEDTYEFVAFDAVLLPAVKAARLESLKESYNGKTLRQALTESLNKANEDEKKIMKEKLEELNIKVEEPIEEVPEQEIKNISDEEFDRCKEALSKYLSNYNLDDRTDDELRELISLIKSITDEQIQDDSSQENEIEYIDAKETEEVVDEAINNGSEALIESLQIALKEKTQLEANILSLQEKLAVSDTKVDELTEEIGKYKATTIRLSDVAKSSKSLKSEIEQLKEELKIKDKKLAFRDEKIKKLSENKQTESTNNNLITEQLSTKDNEIKKLNEDIVKQKTEYTNKINSLTESYQNLKADFEIKNKEYASKISKAKSLVENYKKLTNNTLNRYIESKAKMIGVTAKDITSKLNGSCTVDAIDSICEELQSYKLTISKLPFNVDKNQKFKAKVTESKNDILNSHDIFNIDDDVDDSLVRLANLNK